jgi:hypothetical protein
MSASVSSSLAAGNSRAAAAFTCTASVKLVLPPPLLVDRMDCCDDAADRCR